MRKDGLVVMAVGYVLLNVVPGVEHDVYLQLKDLDVVADITVLFGDYDLIVKLVADDLSSIAATVVESIRQIPGILNSKTLAGAEF
ncbi:MAG TPA: Lrp/AsnC family transcriptional regulator [Candidatus Poseidoniales archaeon]|nr:MAG TPA: Lrp/AsnC family transcriptional regulator [Candidatus Poseidoniales archaeon]HII56995.1 Lrp/AsnC family transcriptional regulator [Candidatus Poseidoniaceae archaeon]|tara:strand:+ start:157 stop:414 length:258 start_codon:yes stop_codon:yes gene_type:complete